MSDGISALYDRIEEEERQAKVKLFNEHSDNDKIRSIANALRALDNFKNCQPRLTEHEWSYINDAVYELEELLN